MIQKVLLIQFRPTPGVREQELQCFISKSGLSEGVFVTKNAIEEDVLPQDWKDADAVVFGGSGDYLVSADDIPEIRAKMKKLFHELRDARKPTLGICFGVQMMTESFGGLVELDEARKETGVFKITKTEYAQNDPVFSVFPESFHVILGHKDQLTKLPQDAVVLAGSERSPVQIYTFPGIPMYGFVFHPELDKEALIYRLRTYSENYGANEGYIATMEEQFKDNVQYGEEAYRAFFQQIVQGKKTYPM